MAGERAWLDSRLNGAEGFSRNACRKHIRIKLGIHTRFELTLLAPPHPIQG